MAPEPAFQPEESGRTVNGSKLLAQLVVSVIVCWGVGHAVGVRDGTNASLAIGWGGGLALTLIVLTRYGGLGDRLLVRPPRPPALRILMKC